MLPHHEKFPKVIFKSKGLMGLVVVLEFARPFVLFQKLVSCEIIVIVSLRPPSSSSFAPTDSFRYLF